MIDDVRVGASGFRIRERWLSRGLVILAVLSGAAAGAPLAGCRGSQAYFDRGDERFQSGKYDEAIADYERGLALEPNSAPGLNRLGMAYREKYNQDRGTEWKEKEVAAFEKAVAADSTYWPALINLGASYYYLGRKAEAAPRFRRALELNPDNPQKDQLQSMIEEGEAEGATGNGGP